MTDMQINKHDRPPYGYDEVSSDGKPQCQTCGIACAGGDIGDPIEEYRGYMLCKGCRYHWKRIEQLFTWENAARQMVEVCSEASDAHH